MTTTRAEFLDALFRIVPSDALRPLERSRALGLFGAHATDGAPPTITDDDARFVAAMRTKVEADAIRWAAEQMVGIGAERSRAWKEQRTMRGEGQ